MGRKQKFNKHVAEKNVELRFAKPGFSHIEVHYRIQEGGKWEKKSEVISGKGLDFSRAKHEVSKMFKGCVIMRCEYV